MNYTAITPEILNSPLTEDVRVTFGEAMEFFCIQIDEKILLCVMIIFSCYIFRSIMLPRAKPEMILLSEKYFPSFKEVIIMACDQIKSFLETGALISGAVLFAIAVYQNQMTTFYWFWFWAMMTVIALTTIAESVRFIRKKLRGNNGKKDIKT